MTFTSTGLREDGARCVLDGQLTIKHITRALSLDLELQPVRRDPGGAMRLTCVGTGALDRSDFDVDFNLVLAVAGS